jgi:hypothetical protein
LSAIRMLSLIGRNYRLTAGNVRTCQFLNWNGLKPYAAPRLGRRDLFGVSRESVDVQGADARRSG